MVDNADDLEIIMLIYNLLECGDNYPMSSESLWNCYRGDINDVNGNASEDKSFKYKTKITGKPLVLPPQWLVPSEGGDRPLELPVPPFNTVIQYSTQIS